MTVDAQAYNITVRRGTFEGQVLYEARIKELPDVVEYAETFTDAYELAVDAIETTAEALAEQGRAMPAPAEPTFDYSGRVTLRVPRSLHRSLAEAAEEESVSLNHYMVSVLSYFTGLAHGQAHDPSEAAWHPVPRGVR